ncbi:hypothetical protein AHAS_Ahas14G0106700 [Arachis hypogaea]
MEYRLHVYRSALRKAIFSGKNVVHQLDLMTKPSVRNEKTQRYLISMRKKHWLIFTSRDWLKLRENRLSYCEFPFIHRNQGMENEAATIPKWRIEHLSGNLQNFVVSSNLKFLFASRLLCFLPIYAQSYGSYLCVESF